MTPTTFRIFLPARHTGFAPDLELQSASRDWLQVKEGVDGWRTGDVIRVPDEILHDSRRVDDERAYRILPDCSLLRDRCATQPGDVALVLESPHKDEFNGQGGEAIGPLRNQQARKALEKHLPTLLRRAERLLDRKLEGRGVALVNAVQYQTSLHALMQDYGKKLRSGVRTPVWHALFHNGGAANLLNRLDGYEPSIVLLAPTGKVRGAVIEAIRRYQRSWVAAQLDYHPSYWTRSAPTLSTALW